MSRDLSELSKKIEKTVPPVFETVNGKSYKPKSTNCTSKVLQEDCKNSSILEEYNNCLANNPREAVDKIIKILNNDKASVLSTNGSVSINPYLQKICFQLYKTNPLEAVILSDFVIEAFARNHLRALGKHLDEYRIDYFESISDKKSKNNIRIMPYIEGRIGPDNKKDIILDLGNLSVFVRTIVRYIKEYKFKELKHINNSHFSIKRNFDRAAPGNCVITIDTNVNDIDRTYCMGIGNKR